MNELDDRAYFVWAKFLFVIHVNIGKAVEVLRPCLYITCKFHGFGPPLPFFVRVLFEIAFAGNEFPGLVVGLIPISGPKQFLSKPPRRPPSEKTTVTNTTGLINKVVHSSLPWTNCHWNQPMAERRRLCEEDSSLTYGVAVDLFAELGNWLANVFRRARRTDQQPPDQQPRRKVIISQNGSCSVGRSHWLLCYPVSSFADVRVTFELGIPCRRTLIETGVAFVLFLSEFRLVTFIDLTPMGSLIGSNTEPQQQLRPNSVKEGGDTLKHQGTTEEGRKPGRTEGKGHSGIDQSTTTEDSKLRGHVDVGE
ncbi:hypothetical protein CLF_109254 [Clonorchis sinensis]|uniref:Uncharacterized protein n=1 Tax=Clonorchis sinensis TaxID=79923 RepID=G7YSF1_CLOSI|nr:hypothetical protein CLF_109254 [Clonorchis sinensis]